MLIGLHRRLVVSIRLLPRGAAFRGALRGARKVTLVRVLAGMVTILGNTDAGAQDVPTPEIGVVHTRSATAEDGAISTFAATRGVRSGRPLFAEGEVERLANLVSNSPSLRRLFPSLPTTLPQYSAPRQASTQPVKPVHARMSKRKAALIGAAVGGGIGAAVGYGYCVSQGDCGAEGAILFAPFGAGIGAGVGLVYRLLP